MKLMVYKIVAYITGLYSKLMVLSFNENRCDNGYKLANLVVRDKRINRNIMVKTKNKSTMTEMTDDCTENCKEDIDNNNDKTNGNRSYTYYSYDQRVFNIYKMEENHKKSSFLSESNLLNRKNLFILSGILLIIISAQFCMRSDFMSWFAFHKVSDYLFKNFVVIVRSEVPV